MFLVYSLNLRHCQESINSRCSSSAWREGSQWR